MEVLKLKVKDLKVKSNYRGKIGDVSELMASIKESGLLQPIGVQKLAKGYGVVFGNRRLSAIKKLGLKEIDALIIESELNKTAINIIENMQRKDVSLYEVGRAINILMTKDKMSIAEISVKIGYNKNFIKSALNSFNITPIKYRDKVVNMDCNGTAKSRGAIGSSVSNTINRSASLFNLNRDQINKFYEYSSINNLSNSQIRAIMYLMEKGVKFEDALKKHKDIKIFRAELLMTNSEYERMCQAHGKQFVQDIMYRQKIDRIKPIKIKGAKDAKK